MDGARSHCRSWLAGQKLFPCLWQLLPSVGGLCKRFGSGLGPTTECRTWSGSKPFDTRTVFLCEYFGRADFDKGRQTAETIKNYPAGRELNQNTGNACPSGASH